MGTGKLFGVVGILLVSAVAACTPQWAEDLAGDTSNLSEDGDDATAFDRDSLLSDAAMRDSAAMSEADIQSFLEKTPWNHASVLATYEEDGRSAAQIIHAAADKYKVNPLVLLVRAQMEQSLVYKETAPASTLKKAFGCGCPDGDTCSTKDAGFANQAACAAGVLSRSMDRAESGTVSGWKKGTAKTTEDKVSVTPTNAATTALYTYTPWESGAKLHQQVWHQLSTAVKYKEPTSQTSQTTTSSTTTPEPSEEQPKPTGGADGQPQTDDTSTTPRPTDTDTDTDTSTDTGSGTGSGSSTSTTQEDDEDADRVGNAAPLSDAPVPKGAGSRDVGDDDDDDSGDDDDAPVVRRKKKASSGGCSSSPAHAGGASALATFLMAAGTIAATRRRRASR